MNLSGPSIWGDWVDGVIRDLKAQGEIANGHSGSGPGAWRLAD